MHSFDPAAWIAEAKNLGWEFFLADGGAIWSRPANRAPQSAPDSPDPDSSDPDSGAPKIEHDRLWDQLMASSEKAEAVRQYLIGIQIAA
jgi:hypothetical protein